MMIETKTLRNGFSLPVFGLGTWMIGGSFTHDPNNDDARDIRAIQEAVRNGITHIDTAESYAAGYTEELVGKAIKGLDRNSLFLVSKVWDNHLKYDDLINSAKNSLVRLGTHYLDLYLIHKSSHTTPLRETIRALDTLVDDGLIKHIGVSNFTVQRMQEAQTYTKNKIANMVSKAYIILQNLKWRNPS
jgi:diketogulonate reductase-like aldo/keto reductase